MKAQIGKTNIICTKNERPNKTNFMSIRSKGIKNIVKTYKSLFTVKVSGETTVFKCEKSVKKREFVISAHFSC